MLSHELLIAPVLGGPPGGGSSSCPCQAPRVLAPAVVRMGGHGGAWGHDGGSHPGVRGQGGGIVVIDSRHDDDNSGVISIDTAGSSLFLLRGGFLPL
eukprot:COSAG01_NODE_8165_length_2894_cov_49.605725_2_plen_97_part_00